MPGVDTLSTALNGGNAAFIASLYAKWAEAPDSVDPSFAELFASLNDESRSVLTDACGASWAPRPSGFDEPEVAVEGGDRRAPARQDVRAAVLDSIRALMMVRVYRVRGHLEAQLDPLGLQKPKAHPELDPATYGFTPADWDRPIFIDRVLGRETATLREILDILRRSYCGPIGVEFMHIQDPEQKAWIQRRIEGAPWAGCVRCRRPNGAYYSKLTEAEGFEAFCQKRYVGTKRFGLEGGEVTIPALHAIIETVATSRAPRRSSIGMPHRGRLNTLVNIVKKPLQPLCSPNLPAPVSSRMTCRARAT